MYCAALLTTSLTWPDCAHQVLDMCIVHHTQSQQQSPYLCKVIRSSFLLQVQPMHAQVACADMAWCLVLLVVPPWKLSHEVRKKQRQMLSYSIARCALSGSHSGSHPSAQALSLACTTQVVSIGANNHQCYPLIGLKCIWHNSYCAHQQR